MQQLPTDGSDHGRTVDDDITAYWMATDDVMAAADAVTMTWSIVRRRCRPHDGVILGVKVDRRRFNVVNSFEAGH